jgi:Uri superfamily endonuclease
MKGVYLLVIEVKKNLKLKIGALGRVDFLKGIYVYVGSAQNNLEKRVMRHRSKNKKIFWHIDYLLNNKFVEVINVLYKKADKTGECKIARELKGEFLIDSFGCSDCKCKSHLFRINNFKRILRLGMKDYGK